MDVLLELSTFSKETYIMQSAFYPNAHKYGAVSQDSTVSWGNAASMMFAARTAMTAGRSDLKDMFVKDVRKLIENRKNSGPMSGTFVVKGKRKGKVAGGVAASPRVGGHFALMALDSPATIKWDGQNIVLRVKADQRVRIEWKA